jgi:hypothetical protein
VESIRPSLSRTVCFLNCKSHPLYVAATGANHVAIVHTGGGGRAMQSHDMMGVSARETTDTSARNSDSLVDNDIAELQREPSPTQVVPDAFLNLSML